ncbi:MAG: hypothetical protein RR891_09435 [Clostridium sp.]|uniref:hypothetical protein n=1 Tax=Clostridium sp. TaxID=1506 RepID=UPI0030274C58
MDKKIYVMLSQTGTCFSRAIKLYTKYNYNHTSIALDKDLKRLYSFGRRKLYFPLNAGFINENINTGIFKMYKSTTCRVYELTVTEEEYKQVEAIIDKFEDEHDKYKYSFIGILAIMLHIPCQRKYHFVCSHFVAHVLKEGKIVDFEKDVSLVKPEDFDAISNGQVVYTGLLSDYAC